MALAGEFLRDAKPQRLACQLNFCFRLSSKRCLRFVGLLPRAHQTLDSFRSLAALLLLKLVHPTGDVRDHIGRGLALLFTRRAHTRWASIALSPFHYFYGFLFCHLTIASGLNLPGQEPEALFLNQD